jgi:hypothetical protein
MGGHDPQLIFDDHMPADVKKRAVKVVEITPEMMQGVTTAGKETLLDALARVSPPPEAAA